MLPIVWSGQQAELGSLADLLLTVVYISLQVFSLFNLFIRHAKGLFEELGRLLAIGSFEVFIVLTEC